MSDQFYNDMAKIATQLIAKFGAPVIINRNPTSVKNHVTGAVTPGEVVTFNPPPKGMMKTYRDDMIDGTRILAGDRLLILQPLYEILPTDKLVISGKQWSIQSIAESAPTGIKLVTFIQVRR